jgi:hypothetical protein
MKSLLTISARVMIIGCASLLIGAAVPLAYFVELQSLSVGSYSIAAGSATSATATMTVAVQSPVQVVSFKSSNPSVAALLSSSMVVSGGKAVVPVKGLAVGCAEITASYGTRSRVSHLVVDPVPGTSSFGFKVPSEVLYYPKAYDAYLTKPLALKTTDTRSGVPSTVVTQWTITSSNPSIVSVPPSVPYTALSTKFSIKVTGQGCAQITAKLGDQSITRSVFTMYVPG